MHVLTFCSCVPIAKQNFTQSLNLRKTCQKRSAIPIVTRASLAERGPQTPAPDYSAIDSNLFNKVFTGIFLSKLESELGKTSTERGYAGVISVVKRLAEKHRVDPLAMQEASERVLMSLFPSWLPQAFTWMFSKPFPRFAAWINAVVTIGVTQWLMGPSKLADDGHTVDIERCRYLEETGCVGVCVNSCKKATETFFQKNMGLDLAIEPDFKDYSCKFQFGKAPLSEKDDDTLKEPCFVTCAMASPNVSKPCHNIREKERTTVGREIE